MSQVYILGAGISGLGAGYSLRKRGISSVILEKDITYGGLCGNFEINGFRFDRFVHFSFSNNEEVNRLFSLSSPNIIRHIPNPYNIYKGNWIKHPAQNNLYALSEKEKHQIIEDFKKRPKNVDINSIYTLMKNGYVFNMGIILLSISLWFILESIGCAKLII